MKYSQLCTSIDSIRQTYRNLSIFSIFAAIPLSALFASIAGCGADSPAVQGRSDAEKKAAINSMYEEFRSEFPNAAEISVEELLVLQETQDVLIVDVRDAEERAVSIIPGAISKEVFEAMKGNLGNNAIVVHCTIGYRSGKYVDRMKAEGLEAYNLMGSILSWVHAGQPVVDSDGNQTRRVHVYGERWNLLPGEYEAVW